MQISNYVLVFALPPFPDWTKFQLGKNIEWIRWHLHIFWSIHLSVARLLDIYIDIYVVKLFDFSKNSPLFYIFIPFITKLRISIFFSLELIVKV